MKKIYSLSLLLILIVSASSFVHAQSGIIRGTVYDEGNGEPIIFTNVFLEGTTLGSATDINGFYSINKVPPGSYQLVCTYLGYDTTRVEVSVEDGDIETQNLYLNAKSTTLNIVEISAEKEEAKTEVKVSTIKVTPKQIKKIPSVGGEPDLVQYLQVIPGVVFTGDQGGQLYIRGGSPIQTKVLMDGITVYNPFHSIGLFSVFETELIRNVDVLTGGFGAEYGGRISAVIDVTTKDGNKKELDGKIGINPFLAKVILEGPLIKYSKETGTSLSYILAAKHSYLDRTSPKLYSYIDTVGLPYSFTDFYGKVTLNTESGSKFSVFGYNFVDDVIYESRSTFGWDAFGAGASFVIVPGQSKTIINGKFSYSNYDLSLTERDDTRPRTSSIGGFNAQLDFKYFLAKGSKIQYGFDMQGYSTKFEFQNSNDIIIDQNQNTTELGAYVMYRANISDRLIIEPSARMNWYAAIPLVTLEPRFGMKLNITNALRFKASGGYYTQNFISTKSDRDVVNLFTGFLSSPEETLSDPDGNDVEDAIQTSLHAITGFEIDVTKRINFNIEGYYKRNGSLININRNKTTLADPNYVVETGNAYGIDFLAKYDYKKFFLWGVYSLAWVDRYDGNQTYNPHYDRRHNINFTGAYTFGSKLDWEFSSRWNFGSGFPFTKTSGFYPYIDFSEGPNTDVLTENPDIGVIYDNVINGGRLSDYHRLDISLKKSWSFSRDMKLEATASVTNVYNRDNIFYFDRVRYERVNQLPLLPSLGITFGF